MEGTIGEIRFFAGNFAPRNWAFCDGQLIQVSQNTALFSILGTIYGGDGRTTFALPDMRGRVATQQGSGPGLSFHRLGTPSGTESNILNQANLPSHTHGETFSLMASSEQANQTDPTDRVNAHDQGGKAYHNAVPANVDMRSDAIHVDGDQTGSTGNNQPVDNMQPSLVLNYIICMQGQYPSRS